MLPYPTHIRSRSIVRRLARRLLRWRYRNFRPEGQAARSVRVVGFDLCLLPNVFDPAIHFTSGVFARYLRRPGVISPGSSVLDLGTGSGLLALVAALSGVERVVAVDINPAAVECARRNVAAYKMQGIIEVREGDGFAPVEGERFDLMVCNPPYFRDEPENMAERAYYGGSSLEWLYWFGTELGNHLTSTGSALVSIGDAADIPAILSLLKECGWSCKDVERRDILVEIIYIFKLTRIEEGSSDV
jgi:methylase of polypeptide subunit release factors